MSDPRTAPPAHDTMEGAQALPSQGADDLSSIVDNGAKIFRYPHSFDYNDGRWVIFKVIDPLVGDVTQDANGKKSPGHLAAVVTHMPVDALKTKYDVEYQPQELGAGLNHVAQEIQRWTQGKPATPPPTGGWLDSATNAALNAWTEAGTTLGNAWNAGVGTAQEWLVAKPFEPAMHAAMRKSLNKYQQQLFEGVQFRSHSMTLSFGATSPEEAASVDNIIQVFKLGMLPAYKGWLGSAADQFFGFPYEWDILFHPDIEANTFRILRSVLSALDVDYVPNGVSFHPGFKPVLIEVKLTFKEMVMLTRDLDASKNPQLASMHPQSPFNDLGQRDLTAKNTGPGARTYRF
jgi:hypothetical protein